MLVVTADDVGQRADAIAAALGAGVDTVQLRDRAAPARALLAAADRLRRLTRDRGARLLVNDRIDVARLAAADGVHLPAAAVPCAAARDLLGPAAWIGRSTHAPAEAARAAAAGADYVVLGPIYATPTKAGYGPPLGPAALAACALPVPLVAIGGITAARVAEVRRAGAAGIAVIRAVLDAPDPAAASRSLIEALRGPA